MLAEGMSVGASSDVIGADYVEYVGEPMRRSVRERTLWSMNGPRAMRVAAAVTGTWVMTGDGNEDVFWTDFDQSRRFDLSDQNPGGSRPGG
jgi:hypothetical protein